MYFWKGFLSFIFGLASFGRLVGWVAFFSLAGCIHYNSFFFSFFSIALRLGLREWERIYFFEKPWLLFDDVSLSTFFEYALLPYDRENAESVLLPLPSRPLSTL